jgi:hypothetical protein
VQLDELESGYPVHSEVCLLPQFLIARSFDDLTPVSKFLSLEKENVTI